MKALSTHCLVFILWLLPPSLWAQQNPRWDDTQKRNWPEEFKEVEIPSSADGKGQKAYFRATEQDTPQPLVVSLHTWSGDYTQKDPLLPQILEKDWNYIHPNFRGRNYTPEACGSPLVVSDIDDAISFAIEKGKVDLNNIHVLGASGGGYATLLTYMQSKHNIRTFSAWAAISDIHQWYYETKARGLKYAKHIALATTGDSLHVNVEEAKSRSPRFMHTPVANRQNSKLFIYTGVHDGYKGSVPITHSLDIYNKVVQDFAPSEAVSLVPQTVIKRLITTRDLPNAHFGKIGNRKIHYRQRYADKVSVTIFEGGHEMLVGEALKHIPGKTILTIGDSNGAMKDGWVNQLKKARWKDYIINTAISGNTVGFVNNGKPHLNTVMQIDRYLSESDPERNQVDAIVILLGTNDCKAVFDERLKEVPRHYQKLLDKIKGCYEGKDAPKLFMVSPPPYGEDDMLAEKYQGAGERVKVLKAQFEKLAQKNGHTFVDIHTPLEAVFPYLSPDGVHLKPEGQKIIANIIDVALGSQ